MVDFSQTFIVKRNMLLARNLRFDKFCKLLHGLLPSEVAHLDWNHARYSLLDDADIGATSYWCKLYCDLYFAGKIWIIKLFDISDSSERHQFKIFPSEGMTGAGGKVREGHFERAVYARIHLVNFAGEAIGR